MQSLLLIRPTPPFSAVILLLVISYLLRAGFQYFVGYWGHVLGVRMESDMRRDLFTHLQRLPFSFYDKNRDGAPYVPGGERSF